MPYPTATVSSKARTTRYAKRSSRKELRAVKTQDTRRERSKSNTPEKNRFPHDFKRWHDIRIDEYATKKAMEDEEKRKKLYAQFAAVAEKYLSLQHAKRSAFICIIAHSPADLIREGEMLHHCVGRMGYDQKFVREETLIFFIRNKQEPDTPFVTVEYSLKNKKILQCYGEHDHKPSEDVLHYVNKVWLPYANKQIRQIAA